MGVRIPPGPPNDWKAMIVDFMFRQTFTAACEQLAEDGISFFANSTDLVITLSNDPKPDFIIWLNKLSKDGEALYSYTQ
jgi:hypothetical protein